MIRMYTSRGIWFLFLKVICFCSDIQWPQMLQHSRGWADSGDVPVGSATVCTGPQTYRYWSSCLQVLVIRLTCAGPHTCMYWSSGLQVLVLRLAGTGPQAYRYWSSVLQVLVIKLTGAGHQAYRYWSSGLQVLVIKLTGNGPLAYRYCTGKGKVFYGQEPPSGESTTTECGFNYQLLAVIY